MINKERLVKTFIELCSIDSESGDERRLADYLINHLKELDIEVMEDDAGQKTGGNAGNLYFELEGKKPGRIFFSAHMDTVVPGKDVKPIEDEEKISSSGNSVLGADDKAGIAVILELIKYIKENQLETETLVFVFSVSEETGLLGAKNLGFELKADYGYILDSSTEPGDIVKQAPIHYTYEVLFKGLAAHAGISPEKGINAIKVAAKAIDRAPSGRMNPQTTANIAIISGGAATNIVPEEVKVRGEVRSFNREEALSLLEETRDIFLKTAQEMGTEAFFDGKMEYDTFNIDESEEVISRAKRAIEKAGLKAQALSAGGGSDANIYNQKDFSSVILGLGYKKIHTKEEYMLKKDLYSVMEIVINIIKNC